MNGPNDMSGVLEKKYPNNVSGIVSVQSCCCHPPPVSPSHIMTIESRYTIKIFVYICSMSIFGMGRQRKGSDSEIRLFGH